MALHDDGEGESEELSRAREVKATLEIVLSAGEGESDSMFALLPPVTMEQCFHQSSASLTLPSLARLSTLADC